MHLSTYDGTIPEPTITIDLNGKDVPMWSGKSVLSYIIPKNINLTMKNNSYDTNPDDYLNKVIIENGEIKSGGLDKKIFTSYI